MGKKGNMHKSTSNKTDSDVEKDIVDYGMEQARALSRAAMPQPTEDSSEKEPLRAARDRKIQAAMVLSTPGKNLTTAKSAQPFATEEHVSPNAQKTMAGVRIPGTGKFKVELNKTGAWPLAPIKFKDPDHIQNGLSGPATLHGHNVAAGGAFHTPSVSPLSVNGASIDVITKPTLPSPIENNFSLSRKVVKTTPQGTKDEKLARDSVSGAIEYAYGSAVTDDGGQTLPPSRNLRSTTSAQSARPKPKQIHKKVAGTQTPNRNAVAASLNVILRLKGKRRADPEPAPKPLNQLEDGPVIESFTRGGAPDREIIPKLALRRREDEDNGSAGLLDAASEPLFELLSEDEGLLLHLGPAARPRGATGSESAAPGSASPVVKRSHKARKPSSLPEPETKSEGDYISSYRGLRAVPPPPNRLEEDWNTLDHPMELPKYNNGAKSAAMKEMLAMFMEKEKIDPAVIEEGVSEFAAASIGRRVVQGKIPEPKIAKPVKKTAEQVAKEQKAEKKADEQRLERGKRAERRGGMFF